MADEFDDLKRAFDAATPAPDAARKRDDIARAEEIFARAQGSEVEARQTGQKSWISRLLDGVKQMTTFLTSRGGLTASTALVAVGLFVVLPDLHTPTARFAPGSSVLDSVARSSEEVQHSLGLRGETTDAAPLEAPDQGLLLQEPLVVTPPAERDDTASIAPAPAAEPMQEAEIVGQVFSRELDGLSAPLRSPAEKSAEGNAAIGFLRERMDVQRGIATGDQAFADRPVIRPESDTEAFASAPANSLKVVTEDPVSTFSIDVDTASYSVVRSSLTAGVLPPRDAVRVEEMINYFPYAYPAPEGPHPFEPTISVVPTPWNDGTQLVHIGIQGELPAVEDRPPLNLVFLIDTSGSMQDANKLPLLKQSFRLMLSELRPEDEVSIVTYAGSAGQVLEPTRAAERSVILDALDRLEAGGSTAGQAGLRQAYQVAEGMAGEDEVTRVILATDGDFNVGLSDPEALKDFIAEKRDSGTYLSVLGFGRGNLDDATMQALAQNGNGQAAYIDTLSEARKVLVDQLTGALFPIANDVKIQVEFNPAAIAEYRLIGYETRALAREDFNNDRVDAGDIGAGHRVTAIYEVTPVGSDAIRNGPLRYGDAPVLEGDASELGFFKLRYKRPGEHESILLEDAIPVAATGASDDVRFSIAMAGFGELLRGGTFLGTWGWDDAIELATAARGDDPFGYRAEAVTLMRLADALDR